MPVKPSINDIAALAKRRGFIFNSSDIYGGYGGIYDYGPYGVELVNNLKKSLVVLYGPDSSRYSRFGQQYFYVSGNLESQWTCGWFF